MVSTLAHDTLTTHDLSVNNIVYFSPQYGGLSVTIKCTTYKYMHTRLQHKGMANTTRGFFFIIHLCK